MDTPASNRTIVLNPIFTEEHHEILPLLLLNLMLGFFVGYVILTQSKPLGSFKYYLMNQVIWAQLFELFFVILRPVFLVPHVSVFAGGYFRTTATPQLTCVFTVIDMSLYLNTAGAVFLSLVNRFIFTFHYDLRGYLHNKYTFAFIIFLHCALAFVIACCIMPSFMDPESLRTLILNETGDRLIHYLNEPSLIYVRELELVRVFCFGVMTLIILFTLMLLGCIVWFVVNVSQRRSNSIAITKTAKSLIVSSLIQGLLCCVFLFLPIGTLTFIWAFKVEGSANFFNFVLFLVTSHGTVDMFCILIFVKPYRIYCKTLCSKITQKLQPRSAMAIVSTA